MESKGKMMIKSVSKKVIEDLKKQGKLTNGMRTVEIFKRKPPWLVTRVKELCAVTSLHGYSHTIQQDYAIWERILWGVASFLALIGSIILLWISWTWNAETPTVTVIESNHYATWNIPFPAITICSLNKISAKAALNLTKSITLPNGTTPEDFSEKLRLFLHFRGYGNATDQEYNQLYEILYNNDLSVRQVIDRVSPTCGEMLKRCMWKGTQWRCDSLFQTINSSEGLCCSFNYFGLDKLNYASKVSNNIPKQPRRVTACGFQTGLSVLLDAMSDDYHSTVLSSYGFKVMIHNAYDYPDENAETKMIMSRLEAFVSVAPESTYSTDDVYPLRQNVRDCMADYEMRMNTMTQYSYVNCLAECRSEIALRKCGCIPFDLPNNNTKPTCNMNHIRCIQDNMVIFESSIPGINSTVTTYDDKFKMSCGCLPDCSTYSYPAELTTGTLNREYSFNALSFFKDVKLTEDTLLHVFFNDLVSTHYRKDIYQNWLGVLASFGGLLGLFLGFSIVTAFELVYFFTIRTFFDRIAPKKRKVHTQYTK